MPVGKPTPDGDIVMGSRHYGGVQRLGSPTAEWDCPACGLKNTGRKPEAGCVHCGAGDPTKSTAGKPQSVGDKSLAADERGRVRVVHHPEAAHPDDRFHGGHPSPGTWEAAAPRKSAPLRVLRLIEYLIQPGRDADQVLRNSLVGRMDLAWGTITATIVDSCDTRQEDLLGLAHRQPGVWLANPEAMQAKNTQQSRRSDARPAPNWGIQAEAAARFPLPQEMISMTVPPMPALGPRPSESDAKMADWIVTTLGMKVAYTLALALSTIAEELAGNMEPERFLTTQEALGLANALMQRIPDAWKGDAPLADESETPPQTLGDV